jgi:hypothetical protein
MLSMTAQQDDTALRIYLGPGLGWTTELIVSWHARQRPRSVTVDGRPRGDFGAQGLRLQRPFRDLVARW